MSAAGVVGLALVPPEYEALKALNPDIGLALYTDGSWSPRDKTGGWAWLALDHCGGEVTACGYASNTTNNRMEMVAWIDGLVTVAEWCGPTVMVVYSDSQYVGLGVQDPSRNRTKNTDLWEELDEAVAMHDAVEFVHVRGHGKGHAYNEYNDRVDKLAVEIRRKGGQG